MVGLVEVDIWHVALARHAHAIFVSAGDRETFATYALKHLADKFDIIIFGYGENAALHSKWRDTASVFAKGRGSKFSALAELYRQRPDILARYQTVWVCDDDLIPEFGDVRLLVAACQDLGLKVISPAHSRLGKLSYQFMAPAAGLHWCRYVNYVEMTCPLFVTGALIEFLECYEGTIGGYADDWWYLNIFEADRKRCAAIVDIVSVINPYDNQKQGGHREVELLGSIETHRTSWREAAKKYTLREWPRKTLGKISYRAAENHARIARLLKFDWKLCTYIIWKEWSYRVRIQSFRKKWSRRLSGRVLDVSH